MSNVNKEYGISYLSEMPITYDMAGSDLFCILKEGLNRNIPARAVSTALNIPRVVDSIDLDNASTASSSRSVKILNDKIESLKTLLNELESDLDEIKGTIPTDIENISVKWENISNMPDIIGEPGKDGLDGKDGKDGENGKDGAKGDPGSDGKDGKDGKDGSNGTYVHIRYSKNPNGNPMTSKPSEYIGISVSLVREASLIPSDYDWSKFKAEDGANGGAGEDGSTYYLHVRYGTGYDSSNVMQFTGDNGKIPGDWLGQYVSKIEVGSLNPNDYSWSFIKGDPGKDGEKGEDGLQGIAGPTLYFAGEYSDTATYEGSDLVRTVVKWNDGNNDKYYISKPGVGVFSGKNPNNTMYWDASDIMTKFIATELLLAEGANLAGWQFYTSNEGHMILKSQTNGTILNGTTGEIIAANGGFKVHGDGGGSMAWDQMKWTPGGDLILLGTSNGKDSVIHIGEFEEVYKSDIYGEMSRSGIKFLNDIPIEGVKTEMKLGYYGLHYINRKASAEFQSTTGTAGVRTKESPDKIPYLLVKMEGLPDKRKHIIQTGVSWDGFPLHGLYIDENGFLKINEENE